MALKCPLGLLLMIRLQLKMTDLHEFIILGGPDPGVGVDDCSFAYCLTANVFLAVLISEGAIDLESSSCGRGVQARDRGRVIVLV